LKNILLWTSFKGEERTWVNRAGLVGLFEVEWKTPHHNILVEFLNNSKLDFEHNRIKIMVGEKQRIIDKHLLAKIFKIYHTRKRRANRAEISDARVTFTNIVDKVLDIYNTNERWVVKNMRSKYVNKIATILPIIY
jgi:hypothetical protein